MARLRNLGDRLGSVRPRVATLQRPPKQVDPFYVSPEWRALVAKIKEERGDRCQVCGSSYRVAGDHIIEIKDGGPKLDPANVQLLCARHHNMKTAAAKRERKDGS